MVSQTEPIRPQKVLLAPIDWERLARAAWEVRNRAHLYGGTAVGAAAMALGGNIFTGCNVEHRFRSHDVHAEVNAISTMVANGQKQLVAILVAAERKRFTPCGACLDWIFEFGGPDCKVAYQSKQAGQIEIVHAHELMPLYPE